MKQQKKIELMQLFLQQKSKNNFIIFFLISIFLMMFSASCSPRYYSLSVYNVTQKKVGLRIVEGKFILRDIREENNEVILEFENVYDELYYKVIEPKSTFKNKDFPKKDMIYQLKLESWFVRSIRGLTFPTPQSSSYNSGIPNK